ncbi:hypothetical protein M8C21_004189, partial [Ambrosia artemisiifolia]
AQNKRIYMIKWLLRELKKLRRARDTAEINKSLLTLGSRENKNIHHSYCVTFCPLSRRNTKTLAYAYRAKSIKNGPKGVLPTLCPWYVTFTLV